LALPALEAFIGDEGQISIGNIGPVRGAAVASDPHTMLAALIRRRGETLPQLLMRLDAALQLALEHDCFVDEINDGPSTLLP
jgi:ribosome assembly protein YihI (activator of Der GTPase)